MSMKQVDWGMSCSPSSRDNSSVPSWIAPRKAQVLSRTPLRKPSTAAPESVGGPPSSRKIPPLPEPTAAELRAPRTPTIPPPVISERCAECDTANDLVARLQNELAGATDRALNARRAVLMECEGEMVRLALAVAERIVGRELTVDPTLVATWTREAVDSLEGGNVQVAVSADLEAQLAAADFGAPATIDTKLPPGTTEVHNAKGFAAVSVDVRLDAMAEALGVTRR